MPKATLQVAKYRGASPIIATCTACGRQFKTPVTRIQKVVDAMASLEEQFEQHLCSGGAARAERSRSSLPRPAILDRAARRLLEPLPLPAYLWEPRTESFLGSNSPFTQLTGYSEEDVLQLDWRDLVAHDDQNKSEQVIAIRPEEDTDQRAWRTKAGKVVRVTRAARLLTLVDDKHNLREAYIALVTHVEGQEKLCASGLLP